MAKATKTGFVEFRHLHPVTNPHGGLTIRFDVDQKAQQISASWALCSMKENFCRARGREIAFAAELKGRSITFPYDRDRTLADNFIHRMNVEVSTIVDESKIDETTRELCRVYDYVSLNI